MQREFNALMKLQSGEHPCQNIMPLRGYCMPGLPCGTTGAGSGGGGVGGGRDRAFAPPTFCLVYDLAPKGSVADTLLDDIAARGFGYKARVRGLLALAVCLNDMHRKGVMHRDVKSANLVRLEDNQIRVVDCGLAHVLTPDQAALQHHRGVTSFAVGTAAGTTLGTPGYVCPTFARNPTRFGPRNELFSFGIVVMELLSGRVSGHPASSAAEGGSSRGGEWNGSTSLYDFIVEDENPLVPDARAGHWPEPLVAGLTALALRCCGKYKDRPRGMLPVLRRLRELVKAHCAWSEAEMAALLETMEARNQAKMQAEWAALRAAAATAAAAPTADAERHGAATCECVICGDDGFKPADGVTCSRREAPHFLCNDCFQGHVRHESEKSLADLQRRGGKVFCPDPACASSGAGPFAEQIIARRCEQHVFAAYSNGQRQVRCICVDFVRGPIFRRAAMHCAHCLRRGCMCVGGGAETRPCERWLA